MVVCMQGENQAKKRNFKKKGKRSFQKGDFEAVLKAATKPLKKEQDEKEPEGT